jgi:predicted Zn-dependent protease with MMP-like domain
MSVVTNGIKLSEWANASSECKRAQLEELVQDAMNPTPEALKSQREQLCAEIGEFECRYEMSSISMREMLKAGSLKETNDICSWLVLLKFKDDIESSTSESRPTTAE